MCDPFTTDLVFNLHYIHPLKYSMMPRLLYQSYSVGTESMNVNRISFAWAIVSGFLNCTYTIPLNIRIFCQSFIFIRNALVKKLMMIINIPPTRRNFPLCEDIICQNSEFSICGVPCNTIIYIMIGDNCLRLYFHLT